MNALQITGNQIFMGKEIPVVLGGFGPDRKCISDKTIAEIHEMNTFDVRRRISDNIKRFHEDVDFIDLAPRRMRETQTLQRGDEITTLDLLQSLGYAKQSIAQAEHIYILSERGYAKLIKIMDTDKAWEVHDKLIDEYFELREQALSLRELSPQLQLLINIETRQREQEQAIAATNKRLDSIGEIVALNPSAWRDETKRLIVKIAAKMGSVEYIREVQAEIHKLVNERGGVSLETRLTNKRRRMADEGACKSARDKVTKVDIIAEDKKLIEIYIAIVKEMAVKYGVGGQA